MSEAHARLGLKPKLPLAIEHRRLGNGRAGKTETKSLFQPSG